MVIRWGMKLTIGPIALASRYDVPTLSALDSASPEMQHRVEVEIQRIVDDAHEDVTKLVSDHREELDRLVDALLEHETLEEAQAYASADVLPVGGTISTGHSA